MSTDMQGEVALFTGGGGLGRVVELNLFGVFYCMKAEIPHMLERGGGVIVNTSSTTGVRGYPQLAPYTASKHGVAGLTKAVALEWPDQGIRIVSVHPAAIETAMVARSIKDNPGLEEAIAGPMGRIGQPREVADVVVFLCSGGASLLTGGQYVIDGGLLSSGCYGTRTCRSLCAAWSLDHATQSQLSRPTSRVVRVTGARQGGGPRRRCHGSSTGTGADRAKRPSKSRRPSPTKVTLSGPLPGSGGPARTSSSHSSTVGRAAWRCRISTT